MREPCRIGASRRTSCRSTSASFSSCTTRADAAKPCLTPSSPAWSRDVPATTPEPDKSQLGNFVAKSSPELQGLCDLTDPDVRAGYYAKLPVAEVWGIGGRTVAKLQHAGVVTIADFVGMDPRMVRDMLTVVGARVQAELRGISCIPLALTAATRKGIAVTRSFGHPVTTWQEMREAVAAYASRAGEKLRAEGLQACHMAVFLQTNPHRPEEQWHSGQRAGRIEPTSDSMALINEALRMLRPLWVPGLRYFKAGVVLNDLVPEQLQPRMLFATRDTARSAKVMAALDVVNARYGRGTLRPLATGIERAWATRHDRLSQRYTTNAAEMLVATAW